MSLIPRWFSRMPSQRKVGGDFFNIGKYLDELEDFFPASSNLSGLTISSDEKNVVVEANVPGLSSKDVEVSIDNNNMLWIRGEKKEEDKDKNRQFYRKSQTTFTYCLPLWDEVDTSQEPEAQVKDGVMIIKFAKKQDKSVETKKIKVKD